MAVKQEFQAESKRLLELMINAIYTQREIFLRELISNASDAIDKIYYKALTDDSLTFNKDDYYIKIVPDKANRTLTISDTGIGMTEEELVNNLGVIAKSGSLAFKQQFEAKDGHNIIGQFGVGFYSAFMVAETVTVISRALGSDKAFKWESSGADGFTVEPWEKDTVGTDIILKIKPNTEEDNYDEFLEEYRLRQIIKKYSDFIRYPIKMDVTRTRKKEGTENEYEEYKTEETINSMVPIWRRNKSELKAEDYENFYYEKRYGFDKPLTYLHISADGAVVYNAILFIPEQAPFDYYTKEYEKGLELYSSGVLIMNKCPDLLPDHFSFVKGMVESEDLSLNISREMLQHDRQLKQIAKNIRNRIKSHLLSLLKDDREKYEKFFTAFGRQLKFGVYNEFGANREDLQDLLLFRSSKEKKLVTLDEYISRMPEDQKYIYYAAGESVERIDKLPQAELVLGKGYELLYLTEDVDEFAVKVLGKYKDKEFRSISGGDLGIEPDEQAGPSDAEAKEQQELFKAMKEVLGDKVKDVRASKRLKSHPVCLTAEGELSIEMEKVLRQTPHGKDVRADKILEINTGHNVYESLKRAHAAGGDTLRRYTNLLFNQALLIEGLPVEDPVAFANDICELMV
ncbi:MAG: molecular chaperone HtpG [Paenibacillaceae bacterium]|nr:MAG: molecular chaperone HtpG [Paenibacillaceae bacterium]